MANTIYRIDSSISISTDHSFVYFRSVTETATITIDWGDGSALETVNLTQVDTCTEHDYANEGIYDVEIAVISGKIMAGSYDSDYWSWGQAVSANVISVTTGDGLTVLGPSCFIECTNLKTADIFGDVEIIGSGAFYDCGMAYWDQSTPQDCLVVHIGSNVRLIGYHAFNLACLTSITIDYGVTYIGELAFDYCEDLLELTLPASLLHIHDNAFANMGALETLTFLSTVPPTLGDYVFDGLTLTTVNVPTGSLNAYQTAYPSLASIMTEVSVPELPDTMKSATGWYCDREYYAPKNAIIGTVTCSSFQTTPTAYCSAVSDDITEEEEDEYGGGVFNGNYNASTNPTCSYGDSVSMLITFSNGVKGFFSMNDIPTERSGLCGMFGATAADITYGSDNYGATDFNSYWIANSTEAWTSSAKAVYWEDYDEDQNTWTLPHRTIDGVEYYLHYIVFDAGNNTFVYDSNVPEVTVDFAFNACDETGTADPSGGFYDTDMNALWTTILTESGFNREPTPPTPPGPEPEPVVITGKEYLNDVGTMTLIGLIKYSLATKQDISQVSEMAEASEELLGKVFQYIGTTTANYTHGFFYECVSDGQSTPTYSWQNVAVNITPPVASGSNDGLMPSAMYTKLDNITTASSSNDGLMSMSMYDKLDGIALATTSDIDAIFS